jgi:cytochrome c peroxidase
MEPIMFSFPSNSQLRYLVVAGWATALSVAAISAIQHSATPAQADSVSSNFKNGDPKVRLGKKLFFDTGLSNPPGQSCASCHAAGAGFSFPDSKTNERLSVATGAVKGRAGFRAVPTIAYAAYLPTGVPTFDNSLGAYVGGLFWDGRATDLTDQVHFPLSNPNEMNMLVGGPLDPAMVVQNVEDGAAAQTFQSIYGARIFEQPSQIVLADIADAIAHYEKTNEVSPFSSKYDAYLAGNATLTDQEMAGLQLVTGSTTGRPGGPANYKFAQCVLCHGIPSDPSQGPDLWTNTCYANIGTPRNPLNPYYQQTNSTTDPLGYNPLGENFVDLGLGDFLYVALGLPSGNTGPGSNGQGDYLQINGTFKAPTLRNVDARPSEGFVKAYMHNGVFKSLKDVVHFYNTRNLTTVPGEVIDFTQANPYQGLQGKPIWPEPEYPSPITL